MNGTRESGISHTIVGCTEIVQFRVRLNLTLRMFTIYLQIVRTMRSHRGCFHFFY